MPRAQRRQNVTPFGRIECGASASPGSSDGSINSSDRRVGSDCGLTARGPRLVDLKTMHPTQALAPRRPASWHI
jgi:hypothetical protein